MAESCEELPLEAVPGGSRVGRELLHDGRTPCDHTQLRHQREQIQRLVVAVVSDAGIDQLRDLQDVQDGGMM